MNVASACSCSADAGSAATAALDRARDHFGLRGAGGEQKRNARREDRRDAHGERRAPARPGAEGAADAARVSAARSTTRVTESNGDPGFVERDVAVAADAEHAEIAARRGDVALVARALPVEIGGPPVQAARAIARQIDMAVKLLVSARRNEAGWSDATPAYSSSVNAVARANDSPISR